MLELVFASSSESIISDNFKDVRNVEIVFGIKIVSPKQFCMKLENYKMTTISLRLPKNYHQRLEEISSKQGISINQFITNTIGEKLSALDTEDYLQTRANRASRAKYDAVLSKVKSVKPDKRDAI